MESKLQVSTVEEFPVSKIELNGKSLRELSDLKARVAVAIEKAKVRGADEFKAEVAKMATARGLTVDEVLGVIGRVSARKPRKPGDNRKLKALYDPVARKTWGGAGRYPAGFDKSRAVPATA